MYRAPLKDLDFGLRDLIGETALQGCPAYADYSLDTAGAVLGEAAKFAETVLDPLYTAFDREGARWTPEGVRAPVGVQAAYDQ